MLKLALLIFGGEAEGEQDGAVANPADDQAAEHISNLASRWEVEEETPRQRKEGLGGGIQGLEVRRQGHLVVETDSKQQELILRRDQGASCQCSGWVGGAEPY